MSLEQLVLYFFCACAGVGGVLMLLARHPMRVALALISVMLSLAGVYAMLGVHVVAVFQVLIYVGAVMVFMVYVIMLLDLRDPSFLERYGRLLVPAVVLGTLLVGALGMSATRARPCGGGRRAFVPDPAVLERIPAQVLAALRTDERAAGRGRRGGHRRHPQRTEERWLTCSCCSG